MTNKYFIYKSIPAVLCAIILGSLGYPIINNRQAAPKFSSNQEASSPYIPVTAEDGESLQLKLNSQSAVLMDGETGRVLYGKEEDIIRPMASTTKIMTCILALEKGSPDDEVEVSSYAAGQPKVHLGAPAGRRFRMEDLLYSLMLESHNDTAVMLAEYVAGDVKQFAAMMNEKARGIGCEDTWFITPNGLDAKETDGKGNEKFHSTTAKDLAGIMSYCTWKSPKSREFLDITETQNYYFTDLDKKGSYSCVNHNAFLTMMDGVLSGKTGFTGGAGYSYVASMEDTGRKYVIALLGCGWPPHKTYKWSDARTLFNYGLKEYHKEELPAPPQLEPIPVRNGIPKDHIIGHEAVTGAVVQKGEDKERRQVLMKEGEQVEMKAELPDTLTAPVYEGEKIGQIRYMLGGMEIYEEPVYAAQTVERINYQWCFRQIVSVYLQ